MFSFNDIIELIFMGKCHKKFSNQEAAIQYRKFLVRRKHILEVMYTNGVIQRTEEIEDSMEADYFISEIQMRQDQRQFVVRYINEKNPLMAFYRGFDENKHGVFKINHGHKIE